MKRLWEGTIGFFETRRGKFTALVGGIVTTLGLLLAILDFYGISGSRTPTPTFTPAPFIELVNITTSVEGGQDASVSVRTLPGSTCFLSYLTPANNVGEDSDLGFATANSQGICSWSWHIAKNTTHGPGELTVVVGDLEEKYTISIIPEATTSDATLIPGTAIAKNLEALPTSLITPVPSPTSPFDLDELECVPRDTPRESGVVESVVDGNSINVRTADGEILQVQYLGIDTPEEGHPWFSESKSINEDLVLGKEVTLVQDYSEADQEGNLLRYVFTDDNFVNFWLVGNGYGYASDDIYACSEGFRDIMLFGAMGAQVGFFAREAVGEEFEGYRVGNKTPIPTPKVGAASVEAECIPEDSPPQTGVVVETIDGDTIDVLLDSGKTVRVRYIGMDTPERGEFLYSETSAKNQELVLGRTVFLFKDVSETDRYGRLLRYILADGRFVNYELVHQGYAQPATYPPDVSCVDIFSQAADYARNLGLGLWSLMQTPEPSIAQVVIVTMNKQAEYVDIQNIGDADEDLTGWVLVSEKGNQSCRLAGVLIAGATLRIWAGSSQAGGYSCGFRNNIWNNSELSSLSKVP